MNSQSNEGRNRRSLSLSDRAGIRWAGARYDFWLEMNSVPAKTRRSLRRELRVNLADAASDVGRATALANLGDLRSLAAETTRDGQLRSRWLAGTTAAATVFVGLMVWFWSSMLYYTEGVLDAGAAEPTSSWLWPFYGSSVTVDPSGSGIGWEIVPGPVPFVLAGVVFLFVSKPWRSLRGKKLADHATGPVSSFRA